MDDNLRKTPLKTHNQPSLKGVHAPRWVSAHSMKRLWGRHSVQ